MSFSLLHPVKVGSLLIPGDLFLAPIAGYSDSVFRDICSTYGADFCYTQMASAEALARGCGNTYPLLKKGKNEKLYAVQLFGSKPESMARAVQIVLETTSACLIDINCGCPVPKINKSGAGVAVCKDLQNLFDIISQMKQKIRDMKKDIPVTMKMRSGTCESNIDFLSVAKVAIEAGIDAITLHPRTKVQGYSGKANWQYISDLKDFAKDKVPIFASGDIFSPENAKLLLEQTKADALMFARGALGNPFIFKQTKQFFTTGHYDDISIEEKMKTAMTELEELAKDMGEESACLCMRKRFCAYIKGIPNGSIMRQKITKATSLKDYKDISLLESY